MERRANQRLLFVVPLVLILVLLFFCLKNRRLRITIDSLASDPRGPGSVKPAGSQNQACLIPESMYLFYHLVGRAAFLLTLCRVSCKC